LTHTDRLISCRLTVNERAVCDALKVALGFATDADLVSFALYSAALHADLRVNPHDFKWVPARRREKGSP